VGGRGGGGDEIFGERDHLLEARLDVEELRVRGVRGEERLHLRELLLVLREAGGHLLGALGGVVRHRARAKGATRASVTRAGTTRQ
jgi:hypothetical protein